MPHRGDGLPVGPGSTFEFILLYGVLATMALAVAAFVATVVVGWFERSAVALAPKSRRAASRSDDLDHRRYAVGFLPIEEEILGLAYLRGGVPKVAETLRAWAIGEGWIVRAEEDRWILKRLPRAAAPWASTFSRPLATGTITDARLASAADAAARELEPTLLADLEGVGFLRSSAARAAGSITVLLLSSWVIVVGAMRVARAPALGEPTWLLAGEVATVALAALGLAGLVGRRTSAADRWLGWLDRATTALRRQPQQRRAEDTALATAMS